MNPTDLIRPNRFTYVSPHVPKAAVSKPQEVQVAPGLPSPTQMAQGLVQQTGQMIEQQAGASWRGITQGVEGRRMLSPILSNEAWDASRVRTTENREYLDNWTRNSMKVGDQRFQQDLAIADRFAQLAGTTTGGVERAIAGEQGNDAARLQLMRDVLMKPKSFTQTLAELTGALAPIAALFVA